MRVGVIIGRFQVPALHDGHKAFIEEVKSKNDQLLIFLGVSATTPSKRDPLDYYTRASMLSEYLEYNYPKTIAPLHDCPNDESWSKSIDKYLEREKDIYGEMINEYTLYCGRDGFKDSYSGKFPVEVIELPKKYHSDRYSGTYLRASIYLNDFSEKQKRESTIYHVRNMRPRVFPTVDIAVLSEGYGEELILLGRKHGQNKWVLPGGFVDPSDESYAYAAQRELKEETKLSFILASFEYCGSFKVDDWRLRKSEDSIVTTLFKVTTVQYKPSAIPSDDLEECQWFTLKEAAEVVADHHKSLLSAVTPAFGSFSSFKGMLP